MKYRCQCGKPDRMGFHPLTTCVLTHYHGDNPQQTLHFKSADRECGRCGTPLCGECSYFATMADYLCDTNYLCHTCVELEE